MRRKGNLRPGVWKEGKEEERGGKGEENGWASGVIAGKGAKRVAERVEQRLDARKQQISLHSAIDRSV